MLRFFAVRTGRAFFTVLICVSAVFLALRLAGDPADIMLSIDTPPDVRAYYRELWGLDRPLAEQYLRYLTSVARGDFGLSFADDRPAFDAVVDALPKTVLLGSSALLLALAIGLPLGILAALRHNSTIDRLAMASAVFGYAIPTFFLGILLFALKLRVLPYDPVRAKALLKEAGYKGEPIVYRTQANYYTSALEAAQILIEQWKAVGINASLQVVENSAQLRAPGAQIFNWSNSTRLPDPLGAIWVAWGPAGEIQVSRFWTSVEAFNKVGAALEAEVDPAKRKALFTQLLDIWEDEAPATILYQPSEAYAIKKSIAWRPTTFYFMDLRPDNLSFARS
jgi:hypothetical protein